MTPADVDQLVQVALPGAALASTWLIARRRLSGMVIAVAAEPLWLFTAAVHHQWGSFVVALADWAIRIHALPTWARASRAQVPGGVEGRG